MSKRCPSCGYHPIGPFTDNCPICAEPVRNVRSSGGGRGGFLSGMPDALKWVLGGLAIGALAVVGCCGVGMWRMGAGMRDLQEQALKAQAEFEAKRQARTVVVSAEELLKEFEKDPAAADEKYAGKYLELTGAVERTGEGRHGQTFVVLTAGDEAAKLKIECFFNYVEPREETRIKRLPKGRTITLRGEYEGQVSNIQLQECVLVK
ncbi:MAG TPA: hypothetical protein VM597_19420 [Gemmataceae bacterium]|nr:hypothetical protein [Gemmataceae bacterium]